MSYIISSGCRIAYLNTLDRVQAFDIALYGRGNEYDEFMRDIRQDVCDLRVVMGVHDSDPMLERLKSINSKLDIAFDTYDFLTQEDIYELIKLRTSFDVSKVLETMCNKQFAHTAHIIDAMNSIKQRSATAPDLAEEPVSSQIPEQTDSGKLMKKHICPVCSNTFETNRKDAQYCSPKCKQAAYRERREKGTN